MMIQQQVMTDNCPTGGIFDFMEYKKKKPFFPRPLNIRLGSPINETFHMIKNIIYKEKQILALTKEQGSNQIILVEAEIEGGQLVKVKKLDTEFIEGVITVLRDTI